YDSIAVMGCNRTCHCVSPGDQFCRESAVEIISEWLAHTFPDQSHARKFGEHLLYDLLIFFRLKTACAVNEHAIGFQQWDNCTDNRELLLSHAAELLRIQAPPHIDAAPHHASVAARSINQYTVEPSDRNDFD